MKDRPTRPAGQVSVEPARDAAEPALSPLGDSTSPLGAAAQAIDGSPRMALQRQQLARTFGPAAGVVQRVTLKGHLDEVEAEAIKEARWDGSFTESMTSLSSTVDLILEAYRQRKEDKLKTAGRPEYDALEGLQLVLPKTGYPQNPDAEPKAWAHYLTVLSSSGRIPRGLMLVYDYCRGISKNHPGMASMGSLRADADNLIAGRPHFHPDIVKGMETKPGHHRRHIIAWHTLLAFTNKVYRALGDKAIAMLEERIKALALDKDARLLKAQELLDKVPDPAARTLLSALYVMNSNPENLWVGEGKENSGINIGRITILNQMAKWQSVEDMLLTVEEWGQVSGTTAVADAKMRAHGFAATILNNQFTNMSSQALDENKVKGHKLTSHGLDAFYARLRQARYEAEAYQDPNDSTNAFLNTESGLLEQMRDSIDAWILGNLDYDVGYDDKRPEEILQQRPRIINAIQQIITILKAEQKDIEPGMVKDVFEALLR